MKLGTADLPSRLGMRQIFVATNIANISMNIANYISYYKALVTCSVSDDSLLG